MSCIVLGGSLHRLLQEDPINTDMKHRNPYTSIKFRVESVKTANQRKPLGGPFKALTVRTLSPSLNPSGFRNMKPTPVNLHSWLAELIEPVQIACLG